MPRPPGSPRVEIATARLANGLRIVAVRLPWAHRVVVDAEIRVGSRFETRATNGLSHFLEHMLFRGIPGNASAQSQAHAFESLGATLSAATSADHGSLVLSTPRVSFDAAQELFGRVFTSPVFSDLEVEKGIVREEINEGLDDRGRSVDPDEILRAAVFGDHSLAFPITGTARHLERFDRRALRAHHGRHYRGRATVVAVAGPLDPERAVRAVEEALGRLAPGRTRRASPPRLGRRGRFRFVPSTTSQTELRVGFVAPGRGDPASTATELLLRTLDDGTSTRLYRRLCDERGLCYQVSAHYEPYEDVGLFDVAVEAANERATELLGELLQLLAELRDRGPTDEEIAKAKARYRWQAEEALDDPGHVAELFALGELHGIGATLTERVSRIDAVSRDAVRDAAATILARARMFVVAVGAQGKRAAESLAARARRF